MRGKGQGDPENGYLNVECGFMLPVVPVFLFFTEFSCHDYTLGTANQQVGDPLIGLFKDFRLAVKKVSAKMVIACT